MLRSFIAINNSEQIKSARGCNATKYDRDLAKVNSNSNGILENKSFYAMKSRVTLFPILVRNDEQ